MGWFHHKHGKQHDQPGSTTTSTESGSLTGAHNPLASLSSREQQALIELLPLIIGHLHHEVRRKRDDSTLFLEHIKPEDQQLIKQASRGLLGVVSCGSAAGGDLLQTFCDGVAPAVWATVIKFLLANDPAGPLVPVAVCAVLVQPREGGFSSFWRQHSSTAAKLRLMVPLLRIHISDLRRTILGHLCHLLHDTATRNTALVREFLPLVMIPREETLKTSSAKRLAKAVLMEREALLHALSFMMRHHADIFEDIPPMATADVDQGNLPPRLSLLTMQKSQKRRGRNDASESAKLGSSGSAQLKPDWKASIPTSGFDGLADGGDAEEEDDEDWAPTPENPLNALITFDFEPENDDELELIAGRTVQVVGMQDDGWWVGRTPDGMEEGIFPGAYVTIMQGNAAAASLIEEREIEDAEREAEKVITKAASSSSSGFVENKRSKLLVHQESNRGLGLGLDRSKEQLSSLLHGECKEMLDPNDVAAVRAMMIREANLYKKEVHQGALAPAPVAAPAVKPASQSSHHRRRRPSSTGRPNRRGRFGALRASVGGQLRKTHIVQAKVYETQGEGSSSSRSLPTGSSRAAAAAENDEAVADGAAMRDHMLRALKHDVKDRAASGDYEQLKSELERARREAEEARRQAQEAQRQLAQYHEQAAAVAAEQPSVETPQTEAEKLAELERMLRQAGSKQAAASARSGSGRSVATDNSGDRIAASALAATADAATSQQHQQQQQEKRRASLAEGLLGSFDEFDFENLDFGAETPTSDKPKTPREKLAASGAALYRRSLSAGKDGA